MTTVMVSRIVWTGARCLAIINERRGWQCKATATRMVKGDRLPDGTTKAAWFCDDHLEPWLAGDIREKGCSQP